MATDHHVMQPGVAVSGAVAHSLRRNRFAGLLCAVMLLILASPFPEGQGLGDLALALLFTAVLIAAVHAASGRRWTLGAALLLALPWVYLTWLHPVWSGDTTDLLSSLLLIVLCSYVLGLVLVRVLTARRVGFDEVCGGIAVYLLLAVVWAMCFAVLEAIRPGSFGLDGTRPELVWNDLLYFSLTTLTTLGYGDISPVTPVARIWASFEAATGSLYLAVLIARLVSAWRPAGEGVS